MQIVSLGDNLYECQILFAGKKYGKYFIIPDAKNFTQHAKR